ncbi:MAG: DNA-binding protein [Bacteroidetes bacterium]|nr:MAG: DNA-binding protein [Bacteroidota bacterium]
MQVSNNVEKPLMLSIKKIAQILDISSRTVVRMNKDGKIRLYRMGGKLFAFYDELLEDIKNISEPVNLVPEKKVN